MQEPEKMKKEMEQAESGFQGKTENEMLAELTALVRKSEEENGKNRLISRAACIVLIVALAVTVPAAAVTMVRAQKTMDRIDTMVDNVNGFVEDNSDQLGNIVSGVNEIDFESLNEAIETLNQDVENLHSVLGILN